mmetsp:Transcript_24579/g.47858  ORF Transcript_24579/g.47858 Transcript_24579/m.47858 type:complete len:581 (-) Transcript_24579:15-1757(-)
MFGRRPPRAEAALPPQRPEKSLPSAPRAPRAATNGRAPDLPNVAAPASSAPEADKKKFTRIDAFEGIFEFLSLEHPSQVAVDGRVFPTAAHAILAAQFPMDTIEIAASATLEEARQVAKASTDEAKSWKELSTRLRAMERVQRDKFRRHEDLRTKLKETGDRDLVWTNPDDNFWGVVKGQGQNHLGHLLQQVRESITNDTELDLWFHMCCEVNNSSTSCSMPIQLKEEKGGEHVKLHRLAGRDKYTLGKVETNDVVALHPSVSRKHAMVVHTKADLAHRAGGVALLDLGSKAGTSLDGVPLKAPYLLVPLAQGSIITLGASTRHYLVSFDLSAQIRALEQRERDLMQECQLFESEAADPVAAAKKKAKEASTLWVGNLDYTTTEADLRSFFRDCGEVAEIRMPGKQKAGVGTLDDAHEESAHRGFAFVVLETELAARRAVSLSGTDLNGRKAAIRIAESRGEHAPPRPRDDAGPRRDDSRAENGDRAEGSRNLLQERLREGKGGRRSPSSPRRRGRSPMERSRSRSRRRSRSRSRRRSPQRRRSANRRRRSLSRSRGRARRAARPKDQRRLAGSDSDLSL